MGPWLWLWQLLAHRARPRCFPWCTHLSLHAVKADGQAHELAGGSDGVSWRQRGGGCRHCILLHRYIACAGLESLGTGSAKRCKRRRLGLCAFRARSIPGQRTAAAWQPRQRTSQRVAARSPALPFPACPALDLRLAAGLGGDSMDVCSKKASQMSQLRCDHKPIISDHDQGRLGTKHDVATAGGAGGATDSGRGSGGSSSDCNLVCAGCNRWHERGVAEGRLT